MSNAKRRFLLERVEAPRCRGLGFTLIEMLVVLVLITLLASLVGPKLFHKVGSSKLKVAKAQIELITSALGTYRLDMGEFPSSQQGLNALIAPPVDSTKWDGPYLSNDIPPDPWDRPYHYRNPGQKRAFALYTLGKDGKSGGEDEDQDIGTF